MAGPDRKKALQSIDGDLQGLLQNHGVSEDVQVAIGVSAFNTCAMFAEFFTDDADSSKNTIKTDGPKVFKSEAMEELQNKTESARLALVWRSASLAAKHQAEAFSQPSVKASAMIMTEGFRDTLCKAYAQQFGSGEKPPAKTQGCNDLLGKIYKDFSSSFPGCYSLSNAVSYLMQHASKRGSQAGEAAKKDKEADEEACQRGPINTRDKFREAMLILSTSMLMVVAALPNKPKIQLTKRQIRKWQEHVDETADSKPRPSLRILINAEFLGRQKAIALCIDDGTVFGEALDDVRRDTTFWNRHVHRPAEGHDDDLDEGDVEVRPSSKRFRPDRGGSSVRLESNNSNFARGATKGKGKSKSKSYSKAASSMPPEFHGKALREPPSQDFLSGKPMCFDFHIRGTCSCNGSRSHLCPNRKGNGFCYESHWMTSRSCPCFG